MDGDVTLVGDLPLPSRLITLIDSGLWPRDSNEAIRLNMRSPVSRERVRSFAPDQDKICLYSPPFSTVARRIANGDKFWSKFGALEQISPELSVVIADFGLGSDSPILLDYRESIASPTVIRLKLNSLLGGAVPNGRTKVLGWANVWLRCANTFDAFADLLGLEEQALRPDTGR
jgi:hypothetical protein